MRHFIYVCVKRTTNKIYGGSNYTLKVWENKGKGKLVYIGARLACTRSHMGEDSEAWQVVLEKFPKLKAKLATAGWTEDSYSWLRAKDHNVKLECLGGC